MDLSKYKKEITENDLIIRKYKLKRKLTDRFDYELEEIAGEERYILYYEYYSVTGEKPLVKGDVTGHNRNVFATKHPLSALNHFKTDYGFRSVTAYFFEKKTGRYCFHVKMTTGNKFFLLIIDNKLKAYFENDAELSHRVSDIIDLTDKCNEALKIFEEYANINMFDLLPLEFKYYENVLNYKKETVREELLDSENSEMVKEGTTPDYTSLSAELRVKMLKEALDKNIHVKDTVAYKERPVSDEVEKNNLEYSRKYYYDLVGICFKNEKELIEDVMEIVSRFGDIDETDIDNLDQLKKLFDDHQISYTEFYKKCKEIYKKNNSLPVILWMIREGIYLNKIMRNRQLGMYLQYADVTETKDESVLLPEKGDVTLGEMKNISTDDADNGSGIKKNSYYDDINKNNELDGRSVLWLLLRLGIPVLVLILRVVLTHLFKGK